VTPPAAPTLVLTSVNPTDLTVTWTASGDDGNTGTASAYELRYLSGVNCPVTQATFASGTLVTTSAPLTAGTPESVLVSGLTGETRYCFMLRVADDAGNQAFSLAAEATTTDGTPPAASVLSGAIQGQRDLGLAWTCVGDDGTVGNPTTQEVRYLTGAACPITTANILTSTVAITPAVQQGCTNDSGLVTNLAQETSYCFVLRVLDEAGNASISNNLNVTTGDFTPPAAPALLLSGSTINTLDISWVAVGDDGNTGTVTTHDLRYNTGALCPMGAAGFASGIQVTLPAPAPAGTPSSAQAAGLVSDTSYCFLLRVADNAGNEVFSNELTAFTVDATSPANPLLTVVETRPTSVTLAWTAVGDNGSNGLATSQQLRYASGAGCPLDSANFATGTLVSGLGAPLPPGSASQAQVTGLAPGTSYCFALQVSDESANTGLSSSIGVTTSDPVNQVGAIRQALRTAAATPAPLNNLAVQGGVVSYVKPGIGAALPGTVDGPGLFIQNANLGPAIFLAVDPTAFAPDLAAGDVVDFVAIQGAWLNCTTCTAVNSLYAVTMLDGTQTRVARNAALPTVQDLTNDAQFADAIGGAEIDTDLGWLMESELTTVVGTLGTLGGGGAGFVKFALSTTGAPAPAANTFSLRLPEVLARARGLATGCTVTMANTPLSRFNLETQVSAWQSGDIAGVSCPPITVAITPADGALNVPESADMVLTFNQPMDIATGAGQPTPGACTGSLQISSDGFVTCYGFNPSWNVMQTVVTASPIPGLAFGTTYQVRLVAGVASTNGNMLSTAVTNTFTTRTFQCNIPTHVVISQIYGGGGNSGATFRNDFVELYNPTSASINLSGLSLQYAAAAATSGFNVVPLSGNIPANGFYLVQMTSGGAVGALLPTPDANSAINMAVGNGKVALVTGTAPLPVSTCPPPATVVDYVGWGTASCFEGTAALGHANTTALTRSALCVDSDNNAADFGVVPLNTATPPRNAAASPVPCAACVSNETNLATELDYCNIQFPDTINVQTGTMLPAVYGQAFEAGITDPAGPPLGFLVEFGIGPAGTNPQWQAGWTWSPALYNLQIGNNDEYVSTGTTAPAPGFYSYGFRFSPNLGAAYTYCDTSGAGSNAGLAFEPYNMGRMVVVP